MSYRIGIGYDIHRLVAGRKLFIGGIEVPYAKGLVGHSDGDVLLHAICDALLGAIGVGDIGEHFPDTDPRYRDIASIELLKSAYAQLTSRDMVVSNIDTVIIAQEPKLTPFKKPVRERIAGVLGISAERISIKAKTNEGIGQVGRSEAIAAYAVVLVNEGV